MLPVLEIYVIGTQSHSFIYVNIAYGVLHSGVVATETKWPAKLKIVSIWPFTESLPTSDLKSPGRRIMAMELPFGYAKEHW